MRKVLLLTVMCIALLGSAMAQQSVSGTVVSESDGLGIPGVTVSEKGTANGALTDSEGKFSIKVTSGTSTLMFSFIGMKTVEEPLNNRSSINVKMASEDIGLDEVVITALGIPKEAKKLGYAVTEVKGEKLAESSTISPVNALQGRAAGVDIAPSEGGIFSGTKITIRGNSTLSGNNMPIFVIDGVIIDNTTSGGSQYGGVDWGNELKNLNADEFESVSVLKGAAATALYGSRALNGVIVITTKKGKERKDLGVRISQRYNVKTVYDGPAFQNIYGEGAPPGYDTRYDDIYAPQKSFLTNAQGEPYLEGASGDWWVPLSYGHKMDGSQVRDYENNWVAYDPQPNNALDAFEAGYQSNTNVTLDGGGENSTFLVSLSHFGETGTLPGNKFTRNSIFSKVTRNFNKYISTELGLSYSNSAPQNPAGNMMQNFVTGNWARNYNTSYWRTRYKAAHGGIPQTQPDGTIDPGASIPGADIWFDLYENSNKRVEESLRLTGRMTFTLTDWFNAVVDGSLNNYYVKSESKILGQGYRNSGGSYELDHSRKEQYDIKLWLNFHKQLNDDFDASLSLVAEDWESSNSYTGAWTTGGLIVPGQYSLSNSKLEPGQKAGIDGTKILQSTMFFTDIAWKNQLFLNVSGRNDWSSTLTYADGSGSFSYFYPSLSLSWLASETFKLPEFVDYGKLRFSWAHVGNDYNPYDINPGFSRTGTVTSYNGDLPRYSFKNDQMPNLGIRPEDKKSIELGFETKMFKNRIGVDFSYYKENTYNQILAIPENFYTGVSSQLINAGNIQNKGIEIALSLVPIKLKDFSWFLNINYARNRNTIIDLFPGIEEYNLYESWNYGNTRIGTVAVVGGPWGVLMSDSSPEVYNNTANENDPMNGQKLLTWNAGQRGGYYTRSYEKQVVGNMNPDFTGSVLTGFDFKNFHVEALFDVKIGGDISTYSGRYGTAYGLLESTLANRDLEHGGFEWTSTWTGNTYDDGYIPEGVFKEGTIVQMKNSSGETVSNNVGGMTYKDAFEQGLVEPVHGAWWHWKNNSWGGGVIDEAVLQENSYIGFRQLTISYRIPSPICRKVGFSSADVAFFGRDLGFVYKTLKDNLNPFSIRSNEAGSAHEWQQSPYTRTLGISLNVTL
ncbi:MAG TPA: SusC/RagA family TonB-linked outer membrane protein [Prolixibacteraceae bacterium]|nr:SusC/RagA family TonB-linked outer membrane protein [Prolixibacteraceae bacterium]